MPFRERYSVSLAVAPPRHDAPRPLRIVPEPRKRTKAPLRPFTLPHFRAWTRDLILDTGSSWRLEDFQEWFIADLFTGVPEAWLVVPEGNAKTTTLAGVALYHAEFRPFAAVPVAAASREQAEILYRQAEGFVLRSEMLHAPVHSLIQAAKGKRKTDVPRFLCLEGYRRINHHGGGRIQVFAADDRTGDGIIPTLGIIDEPHRLRDLALYRTWAGKIAKRGGQIATISTSGEPGSDFEETRERIRVAATEVRHEGSFSRYATPRIVLHEWTVPEGADVEDMPTVKAANPLRSITAEMLGEKFTSPTMTRHHWLRFVCNRPTRDSDTWLGEDGEAIWDDAKDPYQLVAGEQTWVGIDIGLKHDSTAVVAVQRRPDGRLHATCRLWLPTRDEPVDMTDVMQHIRELAALYRIQTIGYDPRFFDISAKYLTDEGIDMVEQPQTLERMTPAIGSLYELIRGGGITHDGDDAFGAQILAAVPRFNDRGFTLAKGKTNRGRIDAAVALALAVDRVQREPAPEVSVYAGDRGMLEVG